MQKDSDQKSAAITGQIQMAIQTVIKAQKEESKIVKLQYDTDHQVAIEKRKEAEQKTKQEEEKTKQEEAKARQEEAKAKQHDVL